MERAAWGYTIVEVMIVLAISGILLVTAMTVFHSQNTSTEFSQTMQDLNSAVQGYANSVTSGSYPGSEDYTCTINGTGKPHLSQPGAAGSACIFLGQAILAPVGQSNLMVYTVLGNKNVWSGAPTTTAATKIDDASPEPAIATSGLTNSYVLTKSYQIEQGSTVKSAKANSVEYDLLGMYNGLSNDSAAADSGGNALVLYGYKCNVTGATGCDQPLSVNNQLQKCIEETGLCATAGTGFAQLAANTWKLCIGDSHSSRTAELDVSSAPGGITTKLNFDNGCS